MSEMPMPKGQPFRDTCIIHVQSLLIVGKHGSESQYACTYTVPGLYARTRNGDSVIWVIIDNTFNSFV